MSPLPPRLVAGMLCLAVAGGLTGALPASAAPAAAASTSTPGLTAETFAAPPSSVRPKMRWWMPLGPMREAQVRAEIADIAFAGFSGVEILGTPTGAQADLATYGFGTPAWNRTMDVVVDEARKRGISVDHTATASYPPAVPQSPDAAAASKEIIYGRALVAGGASFSDALPGPVVAARNGVTQQQLVAVTAARLADGADPAARPVRLVESSVLDLTAQVRDGRLTWTAPAGGQWVLLAWWQRSDGHAVGNVTSPTSYTVDHLSRAGVDALTDFWDSTLLTPEVKAHLAAHGGDIFEDSLHLDQEILWTPELLEEFEARRGYDLTPYLPAVTILGLNRFFDFASSIETPPAFDFTGTTGERVRNDYYQTLTDLYVENHLEPLREWANAQGLKLRVQPSYGQSFEMTKAALAVDVPETESFQLGNLIDGFRSQAAAVHMGDKPVYSTECCASFGAAHAFTWEETLSHVHKNFAGGVNQVVFHGYPHQDGPGAIWPGWYHFGNASFSENYGAQPTWTQVREVTDYLARQQLLLRQGQHQLDVGIYRNSYWDYGKPGRSLAGKPKYYNDPELEQSGYSYEFLSPTLLDLPNATVRGGRLDPTGPAYKALVIDQQADMPVATARKIVQLARAGLPVVVVGAAPSRTPFFDDAALADAQVQQAMTELLALPGVVRVADDADVKEALLGLGVRAAAEPTAASPVLNVHRNDGGTDYYWLYNPSAGKVDLQVSLEGRGRPYELDGWSGAITPIAEHRTSAGRVALDVTLAPGETRVVAITPSNDQFSAEPGGTHVEDGTSEVAYEGKRLVTRATTAGTHRFTLQNGRTRSVRVPSVPERQTLSSWHLSVDDWQPGATPDETVHVRHERDLTSLVPWSQIPGLEDVSGVGTYTTTVSLPTWSAANGAHLDLGQVFDTVQVTVNGRELPGVDLIDPVVDLGGYLRAGTNTIEVEVATTLRNRMRTVAGSGQATRPRQPYGLVGPVVLTPYTMVTISVPGDDVDVLLASVNEDGTVSDRTTASLRDRLDRAIEQAEAGSEKSAIALLQQFVARVDNQVKGDAADSAARRALVAAAEAALADLRAADAAETRP